MTKALNEHLKEVEQKRGRVNELEQSIKDNEVQLLELDESYKNAVIKDSPNIDELFHEMEALQDKIKADKHKLNTLKTVTDEHLRHAAVKLLNDFPRVRVKYQKKVNIINADIAKEQERHQKVMQGLNEQGEEINNDYEDEASRYVDIINDHGILSELEGKPAASGLQPEKARIHEEAEDKATKEGKLIDKRLFTDIERSAEGTTYNKPFKGVR